MQKSRSAELLMNEGGVEKQREEAMKRVLTRQRDTQRRAQEEQQQHMEKRMNAILSLKKNITASEVNRSDVLRHKWRVSWSD